MKDIESLGWQRNNCNYYSHNCTIGEKINIDGYPYKFETIFESGTYFYFLGSEDTVKDLIRYFLEIILCNEYSSSNDYNTMIIFKGTRLSPEKEVFNLFKTKTENDVLFSMRKTLKKVILFLSRM